MSVGGPATRGAVPLGLVTVTGATGRFDTRLSVIALLLELEAGSKRLRIFIYKVTSLPRDGCGTAARRRMLPLALVLRLQNSAGRSTGIVMPTPAQHLAAQAVDTSQPRTKCHVFHRDILVIPLPMFSTNQALLLARARQRLRCIYEQPPPVCPWYVGMANRRSAYAVGGPEHRLNLSWRG